MMKYVLVPITKDNFQQALYLLSEIVCAEEPMLKALKIPPSLFRETFRQQIRNVASEGFSYGYTFEGKLISLVMANPYNALLTLPETNYQKYPSSLAAYLKFDELLHKSYKPPYPESTIYMEWGAVHPLHIKNKMYEKLSLVVEQKARVQGYQYALGIATNRISHYISMHKLHYEPQFTLSYSDFTYNGEHVFKEIGDEVGSVIGRKKLIPHPRL